MVQYRLCFHMGRPFGGQGGALRDYLINALADFENFCDQRRVTIT